jgi:CheY-like chemotaxis protein
MGKILVIDDEKETVELLRLLLDKERHEVLTALGAKKLWPF